MGRQWIVAVIFASLMSVAQKSEWQHGVIVSVTKHAESQVADPHVSSYDIALKVGESVYVVLYTVPKNSSMVEYRVGADLVVLVSTTTLTFNDLRGYPHTVKILRKQIVSHGEKQ